MKAPLNHSPLARSVPLTRFLPRVGGGSAYYVRPLEHHNMTRPNNTLIVVGILALTLLGCVHQAPVSLTGRFTSKDDFGVFVFRSDGVVGYKFPAMFDFYSEQNLPPTQGHYRVVGGQIELPDLPVDQPKFKLEIRDGGRSFLLIREERDGTLPDRALYRRE
jgi:hypothetical protein